MMHHVPSTKYQVPILSSTKISNINRMHERNTNLQHFASETGCDNQKPTVSQNIECVFPVL